MFHKFILVLVALLVVPGLALAATAFGPDDLKTWFDGYSAILMVLWGVVHTRWPVLNWLPNYLVPWVNAIGYVLVHLFVPGTAQASFGGAIGGFAGLLWVTARGGATSAITSLLYDKFAGPLLDRLWKKPVST